jgi:ATP-dependent helicase HepA
MRNDYHPGQRWISESEPELGLGSIIQVTERRVTAEFAATGSRREYARANAPLRRVRFRVGDSIMNRKQKRFVVQAVMERNGLLVYRCAGRDLPETELNDAISFNEPEERLFAAQFDAPAAFDLRFAALRHQHRQRKSRIRGFAGARIDLIPHQLYIAAEVAGRLAPRVLLADEVGLGKTIEACLILHRLILSGRAERVLILVPESLVHQWFVELLRRFNLWFHIFDEERCKAIEAVDSSKNPFLDDQLILSSITVFLQNAERARQALAAGWDVLVIDEAHHLGWSPQAISPEYALVEALCRKTPSLLLLTATPDQLGISSHFARLRLLDPDRFYNLAEFIDETEHYRQIARLAEGLDEARLNDLLDQHGTGRVSFRNTRSAIKGFPRRIVHIAPLQPNPSANVQIEWLASLLRNLGSAKVLLICRTQAMVSAIDDALRRRIKNVRIAVFHEGLSLIQRDRNAAWFADPGGARILICSEIGSEGRNFQFSHHLVLFDLPLDPEILEQRIGRLDRIGQSSEIHVHVPYVYGSSMEVLVRWYQEGLNAFEHNLEGGSELLDRFGARVYDLAKRFPSGAKTTQAELERLIHETQNAHREITRRLQQGRDRLLELNSFKPHIAAGLIHEIRSEDQDRSLDDFMLSVFDHYAVNVEELAPRTYKLGSAGILTDSFPGLPREGLIVTCDRKHALVREDLQFLTWDHPLVTGALDLLLGSEKGNSSFASVSHAEAPALCLEVIYVLECVAPAHFHADRFLPPTPLRVVVDNQGKVLELPITREMRSHAVDTERVHALLEQREIREDLLPKLLEKATAAARSRVAAIVQQARREMNAQFEHELGRLKQLRKVNRSVRQEEIALLAAHQHALEHHLTAARLRLDAIRLICAEATPAFTNSREAPW